MRFITTLCLLATALLPVFSCAGVIVGGTRVVFDGNKREASLSVSNPEKATPYLIQSWVEYPDKNKQFIITPPLFRLDPGQENILRIIFSGSGLPQDRESVFWMNIKSIPSSVKTQQNQLQITVKTRIKLFYRPASLKGEMASQAYKALRFHRSGNLLQVTNPTPYFVSFYSVRVDGKEIKNAGMVAPNGTTSWRTEGGNQVSWQAITDYGGITMKSTSAL